MKVKIISVALMAAIISVALMTTVTVLPLFPKTFGQAPPNFPCWFYGNVYINGTPAPNGVNVTAFISGTNLNWTTQTKGGSYGWPQKGSTSFYIPYNNDSAPTKTGGDDGDTIIFYINETKTAENATYQSEDDFRVDLFIGIPPDLAAPAIFIISPENTTYTQNSTMLTFTINETACPWIAYQLDDQANQTILGNTTLSNMSIGSHRIMVYAKNKAGSQGKSQQVYFSIKSTNTNTSEPFPLWQAGVIFFAALAVVVALSLLLRRRSKSNQTSPKHPKSKQRHY